MSYGFCPLRIIIKGEENADCGFLPDGNYITINGTPSPLKHCCTLEMPLGHCEVFVNSPPPNTIHRVETDVEENQLYYITLVLDSRRNIVDASFGCETITEDPFGLYENDFKSVMKNRPRVEAWRESFTPPPAPRTDSTPSSTSSGSGGGSKTIGCGLIMLLFFGLGIILCLVGNMEIETYEITEDFSMTNLGIYIGGAVIGLLAFIGGLLGRNSD